MAIKIQGTTVVNDSRELQNIQSIDATTIATLEAAGFGGGGGGEVSDITKGTLTKSFAQNETASITLSAPISVAPVVSAIKEIPQVGILSKSNWDVASNGANYDRHDTAYSADLSVTSITVSDLESTTYDNIIWNANTDGSNDFNAASVNFDAAFNNDGTKFFRLDDLGTLNQYVVSTAYDLSTTSYDNTAFDFNFQFGHGLASVAWSTDGTKLFGNDVGFGVVRQYSVPTAFDLSTVNDDSVSVNMTGAGLEFDSAGSQFFVLDSPFVQSFSGFAGTFNISGATFGSSFDVTHPTDTNFSPYAFVFSSDGSRLYISYQNEFNFDAVEIREVELTTDYDLTTASFTGKTLDITSTFEDSGNSPPTWLLLEDSDTKLYVNENFNPDKIYQFTFGTDTTNEFSLSTGSFASSDVGKQIEGNGGVAVLLDTAGSFQEITAFNDNSTIPAGEWGMFALKFDSELGITLSGIAQKQSISNAVYDNVSLDYISDTFDNGQSFVFNQDGTVLYFRTQDFLYSYNLSQPYDLSTAGSFTFIAQTNNITNFNDSVMEFGDAGSKFYLSEGSALYQYDLGTAYDLSPSSVDLDNGSTGDAFFSQAIKFVKFNTDGTKIFIQVGNFLQQRSLSTSYDIDTISSSSEAEYNFSNQDGITVHGGDFSQDGSRLFVVGEDFNATYNIFEYDIATPFDISTISYSGNSYNDTNLDFAIAPKIRLENNDSQLYIMIRQSPLYQYSANLFNFAQPVDQYLPAVTNVSGEIDTTTWLDINAMVPDDLPQAGEVYYAVSTDGRTEWRVIDNTDGERIIARLNAGTWEYNSATTYTTDTFTAATTNQELYALQEALAISANRMDKAQLEAVTDSNHYVLGDTLDLMIALYQATGAFNTPSSDGVAIDYDAETLNQGAVHGIDYDYDFPDSTTVRVTSNAAQNLKIRII